jgi:hypothetical protein
MTANRDFLVWASLVGADFDEKTLEFRIDGDMPLLARGRYAIVDADKFGSTVRQARLWCDSQQEQAA